MDKRFSPRMHVGREELYTDLEARIRYLHSFLDFGSRTFHPLPPPPPGAVSFTSPPLLLLLFPPF